MNIKNKLKRYIPCDISCGIKQLQSLKSIKKIEKNDSFMFNKYGEKIKIFYLCDTNFRLDYSSTQGRIPRNIFWDRSRYTLQNHFYTDDMIFTQRGKPTKKYGILLEPETLQPKKYDYVYKNIDRFKDYEFIFTHSKKLLDKLPNAKPIIVGGVYVGTEFGGGEMSPLQYTQKSKNISIVSSDKQMCKLHKIRYDIAKRYNYSGKVDCFGTFNGRFIKIWDSLANYRYSFAIENCIEDFWITERICNCFASMTIPIYLGSPKIGDYFNIDGIIVLDLKDIDNIDKIIERCTKEYYEERIDAIIDNYNKVQQYLCMEDWLYNTYKNELM